MRISQCPTSRSYESVRVSKVESWLSTVNPIRVNHTLFAVLACSFWGCASWEHQSPEEAHASQIRSLISSQVGNGQASRHGLVILFPPSTPRVAVLPRRWPPSAWLSPGWSDPWCGQLGLGRRRRRSHRMWRRMQWPIRGSQQCWSCHLY